MKISFQRNYTIKCQDRDEAVKVRDSLTGHADKFDISAYAPLGTSNVRYITGQDHRDYNSMMAATASLNSTTATTPDPRVVQTQNAIKRLFDEKATVIDTLA